MKSLFLLAIISTANLSAQTAAADPVVAVVEGREWKQSEIEQLVRTLPAAVQRNYYNDKRGFLQQFGLMTKLAALAETEGLDKEQPHASRLFYNRTAYLASARADTQSARFAVKPEEQRAYYEEHKKDYALALVKVIYLGFNDKPVAGADPKATKPRTSAEAEKTAAEIVRQARAGADFVALVRKYSDDADSKAKGGDFTPIKPSDNALPAQIRSAIFALKAGEISDPVRQAGGFWVFKLSSYSTPDYDKVKDEIFTAIQGERFRLWMEGIQKSVKVEFKDPAYLDQKSPAK